MFAASDKLRYEMTSRFIETLNEMALGFFVIDALSNVSNPKPINAAGLVFLYDSDGPPTNKDNERCLVGKSWKRPL